MSRLLVVTVPLAGHVHPMQVLVSELVARGHQAAWCTGRNFASAVARTGATFVALPPELDFDDRDVERDLPALRGRRGLARVRAQLLSMFVRPMLGQLRLLEALDDELQPDALLSDAVHLGAALLSEKRGVPWASLGVSPLVLPSVDVAPFGTALGPARNEGDRVRNRILHWLVREVLFASVHRGYVRGRQAAGLPVGRDGYFDVVSPFLHLQPTIPAFEYPRSDLPPSVRFIGPLQTAEPGSATAELPPWWPELQAARNAGTKVVLVTQGTLATDPRELLLPALSGLAEEPVRVVAIMRSAPRGLPANVRTAPYVPYESLLPLVSVMVTNAGYHGAQLAIGHGVPVVAAGGSEDKPEVAARVAFCGLGVDLRTGRPSASAVRRAVRQVLAVPSYAARARALAAEAAAYDARSLGADAIEALIAKQPRARAQRAETRTPGACRKGHAPGAV